MFSDSSPASSQPVRPAFAATGIHVLVQAGVSEALTSLATRYPDGFIDAHAPALSLHDRQLVVDAVVAYFPHVSAIERQAIFDDAAQYARCLRRFPTSLTARKHAEFDAFFRVYEDAERLSGAGREALAEAVQAFLHRLHHSFG